MKKIKSLGIAFAAVFAMSAVAASAASAAEFMSEGNVAASVEGSQSTTHTFSVEGSNLTCGTAKFATVGLVASPASSITIHPIYTGCTAFGFINSTVKTTGCDYVLSAPGNVVNDEVGGNLVVQCEAGKKITIVSGTCEVSIAPQEFTSGLNFVNNTAASPKNVTLEAEITGIAATKVKDGFLCPLFGTGAVTGSFTGDTLVKGFSAEATQVGITVE